MGCTTSSQATPSINGRVSPKATTPYRVKERNAQRVSPTTVPTTQAERSVALPKWGSKHAGSQADRRKGSALPPVRVRNSQEMKTSGSTCGEGRAVSFGQRQSSLSRSGSLAQSSRALGTVEDRPVDDDACHFTSARSLRFDAGASVASGTGGPRRVDLALSKSSSFSLRVESENAVDESRGAADTGVSAAVGGKPRASPPHVNTAPPTSSASRKVPLRVMSLVPELSASTGSSSASPLHSRPTSLCIDTSAPVSDTDEPAAPLSASGVSPVVALASAADDSTHFTTPQLVCSPFMGDANRSPPLSASTGNGGFIRSVTRGIVPTLSVSIDDFHVGGEDEGDDDDTALYGAAPDEAGDSLGRGMGGGSSLGSSFGSLGGGLGLGSGLSLGGATSRPPKLNMSVSMPVPDLFLDDFGPAKPSRSRGGGLRGIASPRGGGTFMKSHSMDHRGPVDMVRAPMFAPKLPMACTHTAAIHAEFDKIARLPVVGDISPSFRMTTQNRHRMFPFSHTAVRLSNDRYVNASHVSFPAWPERRYVAAMGPLAKTVGPFWTMVWEENVSVIAMVTKRKEGRRDKCYTYWPELGDAPLAPEEAGVSVEAYPTLEAATAAAGGDADACSAAAKYDTRLLEAGVDVWDDSQDTPERMEITGPGIVARHFVLRHVDGGMAGPTRALTQLQMVSWPDGDVPEDGSVILLLRDLVRARHDLPAPMAPPIAPGDRPILAHCSAGVGRTGTFIVIDRIVAQLQSIARGPRGAGALRETTVDIAEQVCTMRRCRQCMCYTPEQYAFVYSTVAEQVKALMEAAAQG